MTNLSRGYLRKRRPPVWYKSASYRSRAVADTRGVLRDFGVELPADTEIRVWDSTFAGSGVNVQFMVKDLKKYAGSRVRSAPCRCSIYRAFLRPW